MKNFQAVHYIMLACGALASGIPQLEAALPAAATPYLKAAAAVLVLLTSVLGVVSPPALGSGSKESA